MMGGAFGNGDMLFGVVNLYLAAGIYQYLFFVAGTGGKAGHDCQKQEAGYSLHI